MKTLVEKKSSGAYVARRSYFKDPEWIKSSLALSASFLKRRAFAISPLRRPNFPRGGVAFPAPAQACRQVVKRARNPARPLPCDQGAGARCPGLGRRQRSVGRV